MFFISHSNNREYFLKQKFNKYLNPYPYPYYLLILVGLQQLKLIFSLHCSLIRFAKTLS